MSISSVFNEDFNKMTEEMIANKVLSYSDIDYENIPIRIDLLLKKMGFILGTVERFKGETIAAGIAYAEQEFIPLNSNRYYIQKRSLKIEDGRYLMAIAVSHFILEANNDYYNKTILEESLTNPDLERIGRVARALLMPQKSMSTLLMSPLISKDSIEDKITKVAKAFLVPHNIAELRMKETGFI